RSMNMTNYRDQIAQMQHAAAERAIANSQRELTDAARSYEDAIRDNDPEAAATWLSEYVRAQHLIASLQPQQSQAQWSNKELEWLSQRRALLEQPGKWDEMMRTANHLLAAGHKRDSAELFAALDHHLGIGVSENSPDRPLDPNEVCRMCGIDADTYNRGADRL